MFHPTYIARALALLATACTSLSAAQAQTKTEAAQLERVEITGSSIKRIASEGSLPVQVLTAKEIARSGAASAAEVIQRLPAMQGFAVIDSAVGGGGGRAEASIHDIGASYTLVLLNGRRVAPAGSGNAVDLNAIPLSAIERVEVLTDGASALYGADAIAGVINFVLKKNARGVHLEAGLGLPLEGGGRSGNASITAGFGDLAKDRFNVMLSYRHDEQRQLAATERKFGSTSYLPVSKDGKNYIYDQTSGYAVPANAQVDFDPAANLKSWIFNPYYKAHGDKCAPGNFYSLSNGETKTALTERCAYDFASTIEIYPENKRDTLFVSGQWQATEALRLYSDIALSRFQITSRVAANPVPVDIPLDSPYFKQSIQPWLTPAQLAAATDVTAFYRGQDFGLRTTRQHFDTQHIVLGAEWELGSWTLGGGLTYSDSRSDEVYDGGYFRTDKFEDMLKNVRFDPFVEAGKQTPAVQQLMQDAIFHGATQTAKTTLTGVDVRASGELYKLPAGPLSLGLGGDLRNYAYEQSPSAAALQGEIYNYNPAKAYSLERKTAGLFVEALIPLIKNLELTTAWRYDKNSAVKDKLNNTTVGQSGGASTYKVAGRYQVLPTLLLRGSYGTGFKSPSMLSIAQPEVPFGVTGNRWPCPFPDTPACKAGQDQYTQMSGGNANLRPETSTQAAFGLRFEPNAQFGAGLDYWQVKLKDAVSGVSEEQAFADPAKYKELFTTYQQPKEKKAYYAFRNVATNIGQAVYRGIDWNFIARAHMDFGRVTGEISGTYMIESSYTRAGTTDDFTDSLGRYGENGAVTARNISRATLTVDSGALSNALTLNMRSGYQDRKAPVRDLQTGKNTTLTLDVPAYYTVDWQGLYSFNKQLELRLGVKNLLNQAPPLSLRSGSGHQVGYDSRYASPMMRTVYLSGSYRF
ncbi:iron complex outermembrane receptor protein [Paucibacter oligotrophus]|uniref:Iron complex outermembrane receptor protein n=1 Tax=Roseateles oligotrophus TaxID=1769250 RepID=A0A840LCZ2_9BURK|nr:TonB-dependent receptor [Roseateles oligotrophus]MBB4845591.1 iron complex outermembrane receptor protein [Roseateles oligotrophus]